MAVVVLVTRATVTPLNGLIDLVGYMGSQKFARRRVVQLV